MVTMRGFGEVYEALKARQAGPNVRLNEVQRAESRAFSSMISSRLGSAALYEAWADEKNFFAGTAAAYASTLPLLLRPFLPKARHSFVRYHLAGEKTIQDTFDEAAECINALEARLGSRFEYFYGSSPSTLDAVCFAYISFTLFAPCPYLQSLLASCPNLTRHTERIGQKYFTNFPSLSDLPPTTSKSSSYPKADTTDSSMEDKENLSQDERNRRKGNRYFLGACAASFAGYVLLYDSVIGIQPDE